MNELALFAGVGGGLLGTKYLFGTKTVCYVEWDRYCVEVLKARIKDGYLDDAPIWDDVNTFDGRPWAGSVDIITAGFPCQPFSNAGKNLGELDPRNGWPGTNVIIRQIRPRLILLENVSALLSKPYVRRIFGDLAESGYAAQWCCLSAAEAGAPHLRDRVWILAYTNSITRGLLLQSWEEGLETLWCGAVINSKSKGLQKRNKRESEFSKTKGITGGPERSSWWKTEPGLGRVVDGMANRVDRLKAIGNGQVPAVVGLFWEIMNI